MLDVFRFAVVHRCCWFSLPPPIFSKHSICGRVAGRLASFARNPLSGAMATWEEGNWKSPMASSLVARGGHFEKLSGQGCNVVQSQR